MSAPACVANAIADALDVTDVRLPATPRAHPRADDGLSPPRTAGRR